ncbi:peptide ABC transporter substrate-binding protein, partial [Lentilactobacillus otakiensis]
PSSTPIKFFRHGKLIINEKQANKLGIKVPANLLKEAQQKGELIK